MFTFASNELNKNSIGWNSLSAWIMVETVCIPGAFILFFSLFARIYLRFGCDLFCIQRRRYINLNKWSIHITRIYSRHTACAVFFVFSAFVNNSLKLWNDEKKIQFIMDFRLVFQANIHHFMNFFCVCINIFKRWKHFKCLD